MTTYCRDCDCVAAETRKRHWASWECLKHPTVETNYVDPDQWDRYKKCRYVNTEGNCPDFTPRRTGKEV